MDDVYIVGVGMTPFGRFPDKSVKNMTREVLDDASLHDHAKQTILDTFHNLYNAAYNGNRAPIVVGNHMNPWLGGGLLDAVDAFIQLYA